MSRPRLIETGKFYRHRDRDLSRLGNFIDVETETFRDWDILRLSRPRPIETGQKMSRPRLYRESRWSLGQISSVGNKRNRNLPAETRNFPKPKFGSGFVPAHFQASWFRFRYLVLKFLDFLVIQEVLPWIPGLTRNFLVKPRTSWLTQEILGESSEESLPNQIFAKKNVCF